MSRTPRTPRSTPSTPSKAKVAAAIAALPFAPDRDPSQAPAFEALPEPMQAAIAESIAKDRAAGLSGHDLRERYSGKGTPTNRGLTGPQRRKVLRAHGFGKVVARSYAVYTDGEARKGSAHAKQHGALAAERQAAELAAVEQAASEAKQAAAAERKRKREAAAASKAPSKGARKATPRKAASKARTPRRKAA